MENEERDGTVVGVALGYLEALSGGDPDDIAARVTEDFHNDHTSALADPLRGRAAYRERLPGFLARFRGLRYEPEAVIADGALVAVPYLMTATHLDDTGDEHPIAIRGCVVLEIADGLVARRTEYWDSAEFLRQVGGGGG